MFKICVLGAGSTVFTKNLCGDCILTPEVGKFEIALFDIDLKRLEESRHIVERLNKKYNGKAIVRSYTDRLEALKGSRFVINTIAVGGYDPCTIIDFEVPKKYGLKQTVADTLGVGGIFRALRTIPVIESIAEDMHKVCPDALMLNYSNPMAILTGYMQRYLNLNAIGLCHSVQGCVPDLLKNLGLTKYLVGAKYLIAGVNHQAWLLNISDKDGNDLYPLIKETVNQEGFFETHNDKVRLDILKKFGYYNTESSEHTAEYNPYYIKDKYPELIEKFEIPIDEYLRRCVYQIENWNSEYQRLAYEEIEHQKTTEYASYIIDAVINNRPFTLNCSVLNNGYITNLPQEASVEIPCIIDGSGIYPQFIGKLPEQLAALNRTNINVHLLAIEAARNRKKESVYHAVFLDPHTSSELSLDDMIRMCDDLFIAHKDWLPEYK